MRNLIIGVAAAVMAMAAPSLASADVRATVGAQYSNVDVNHGNNVNVYGLNGAFNSDFGNGWTIQGDAANSRVDGNAGAAVGVGYGAVSVGVRNDQWSAYGFVGLADGSGISSTTAVGIGGQVYLNNITLDASFTYADVDGAHSNPTVINVDGSYFFNDNFAVSARYAHIDPDTHAKSVNVWGVGAEYRFSNSPISVNVSYDHADTNPNSSNIWSIGLKMDLGSDSLRDRSTHGPSWNGASSSFGDASGLF